MKRTPLVQEKEVDILNEATGDKALNELRVAEGIVLYIEDKMTEQEFQTKTHHHSTKWANEFDIEKNSYYIRYNKLITDDKDKMNAESVEGASKVYTESIIIDRRSTVEDLKK